MTQYLVQPKDRIFVKGYRFLSFARNMDKILARLLVKTLVVHTARNFLIMLSNLQQMHLKLFQKE